MVHNHIFATALCIADPWFVQGINFDAVQKTLTIQINFVAGSRFAYLGMEGVHPVHDTQRKRYRHLNFFQHECYLEVRGPRIRLPDGRVALVEPNWAGHLSGFTLLFETLVLMLARQMPFAAVARIVRESWHRVAAICPKYVDLAVEAADLSDVRAVAIDETSCQRGHAYLTLVADAHQRKVLFVTEGRDATTLQSFAQYVATHGGHRLTRLPRPALTYRRPSSKGSPTTCPRLTLRSTNFMSWLTPRRPWTRCAGPNSKPIRL